MPRAASRGRSLRVYPGASVERVAAALSSDLGSPRVLGTKGLRALKAGASPWQRSLSSGEGGSRAAAPALTGTTSPRGRPQPGCGARGQAHRIVTTLRGRESHSFPPDARAAGRRGEPAEAPSSSRFRAVCPRGTALDAVPRGPSRWVRRRPDPGSAKKTNTDVFARDQEGEKSPPLPRLRAPPGRGAGGNLLGSRGSEEPGDADGPRPAPPPSAGCASGPAPSPGFPRALSSLPFVSASPSPAPRFPPARTLALSGSPAASL
ncbi:unnamed protein product [Rangifer tarandus platyrhynchus]|uniref:Uncharacterized protein n=1 Tax=Rangifer tarandus platyrhynchus TaxID=3082113 RepID=A0ABN8YR24_RANTA|nr:unnamed protein product [Rangifer tarandus platyrhynchus]